MTEEEMAERLEVYGLYENDTVMNGKKIRRRCNMREKCRVSNIKRSAFKKEKRH
jgi:hypothetical protein